MAHANSERKPKTEVGHTWNHFTMSEDDALILDRLNSRENSTLTFATLAASFSLVVLALSIGNNPNAPIKPSLWLSLVGISFAVIGVAYREITFLSVDYSEYGLVTSRFRRMLELSRDTKLQWMATHSRRFIARMLLWLPVIAWLIVAWSLESSSLCMWLLVVIFGLVSALFDVLSSIIKEQKAP